MHAEGRADRWLDIIERFQGRRVLVIGDVVMDRYLWGDVERTSPEAPVPVVLLRRTSSMLGGASNVISNLVALGGKPMLVGVIGQDEPGEEFRQILEEKGVATDGLVIDPGRPTTIKTRVISQGQQLLRMDQESTRPLTGEIRDQVLRKFEQLLAQAEAVILSDYDKGVLHESICPELIAMAKARGKLVIIDPKGVSYRKYRGADILKPNQKEAQTASGIKITDEATLTEASRVLQEIFAGEALVITRGADGVSVFERGGAVEHISSQARSVYDVTGAGDSFISAMAMALVSGASLADAARLGNAAGSIVVSKLGASTADPQELLSALHPEEARRKLRTAAQMQSEVAMLKALGKRIVFANGCFDLLHLGHLQFLQAARQCGDVLIVGLNSDASVREIKGPPRPVIGEDERIGILSTLDAVDYIVLFNERTPAGLLQALKPSVLVKGKNVKLEEIADETALVERYGGEVRVLPILGAQTTDRLLERIGHVYAAK